MNDAPTLAPAFSASTVMLIPRDTPIIPLMRLATTRPFANIDIFFFKFSFTNAISNTDTAEDEDKMQLTVINARAANTLSLALAVGKLSHTSLAPLLRQPCHNPNTNDPDALDNWNLHQE
ncbi:unnamed protein product [Adineta ricciae]|uniref:Uncharacterized protein n=1 Tax=Adineta ricciae TaxID=249248 RepID=A0A815MS93_ADIRI|nr:unnamed protein product [Adineta ricciae]